MEIELKLVLEDDVIAELKKHPAIQRLQQSPPEVFQQKSIYFDTPDAVLHECGISLRVRETLGTWVQTLKINHQSSAVRHRHEWETGVHSAQPDLFALRNAIDRKAPWKELISEPTVAGALKEVFESNIKRTRWDLLTPDGDSLELVLDEGLIEVGDRSQVVREIEIELKAGSALGLIRFAQSLLEDIPMCIGFESKSERGYRMTIEAATFHAVKAEALVLKPMFTIEQAFEKIIENCLSHIQANQAGVAHSADIRSLHQMRVGLRRLKSALRMFSDVIALPDHLQTDLDWLAEQLGGARDWDVLATNTLKDMDSDSALDRLKEAAFEKAKEKHQAAAAALNSTRFAKFMLSLLLWLGERGWRKQNEEVESAELDNRLKPFSEKLLKRDRRRLASRGNMLQEGDSSKRHKVRIAAKKMRYDTEFFQSLYSQKKTKNYVKALSLVQDELGRLNDISVGQGLLRELKAENSELVAAAEYVRGYLTAREIEGNKEAAKLWKKFKAKHLSK